MTVLGHQLEARKKTAEKGKKLEKKKIWKNEQCRAQIERNGARRVWSGCEMWGKLEMKGLEGEAIVWWTRLVVDHNVRK